MNTFWVQIHHNSFAVHINNLALPLMNVNAVYNAVWAVGHARGALNYFGATTNNMAQRATD
jgi:hypothetical protein